MKTPKPRLTPALVASAGALLLVGALFLSLFLPSAAYRTDDAVVLPADATQTAGNDGLPGENLRILDEVQVTRDNIQQVVASLSRPSAYTARITSRLYYGETSGEQLCRQTVKHGAVRTDYLDADGNIQYTELLWDGTYAAWRPDDSTFQTGAQGAFTADQSAMLPTYETVCQLPEDQITGGALVEEDGALTLTVDTESGGEIGVYRISAQTGLLTAAAFSVEGVMTRAVEVEVSLDIPDDALFVRPGETDPVYGVQPADAPAADPAASSAASPAA